MRDQRLLNLEALSDFVEKAWPFDAEHYHLVRELGPAETKRFALRHITFHQMKAAGKLAAIAENLDHGNRHPGNRELELAIRNSLINTLRLARVVRLRPAELVTEIEMWADEEHKP